MHDRLLPVCYRDPFTSLISTTLGRPFRELKVQDCRELGHLLPHDRQEEEFGRIGREYTIVLRKSEGIL
jgi:hypothetical protein